MTRKGRQKHNFKVDGEVRNLNCVNHIKIENGKYEIVIGSGNGEFVFKALRNGEEWLPRLELVEGSNMIMSMAYELQDLRHKVELYENGELFPGRKEC